MPERPRVSSEFYDTVLGRDPYAIAIERPLNSHHGEAHEIVRSESFSEPTVRAFASRAKQIDVIDFEIVVLHEADREIPPMLERQLSQSPDSNAMRTGFIDGRWAFVLPDRRTWIMAGMGYVDRVRVMLDRGVRPPILPLPSNVSQLVFLSRRPEANPRAACKVLKGGDLSCYGPISPIKPHIGLVWILIATKNDRTIVTHAHYTHEAAVELSSQVNLPLTVEAFQHDTELYTRGF